MVVRSIIIAVVTSESEHKKELKKIEYGSQLKPELRFEICEMLLTKMAPKLNQTIEYLDVSLCTTWENGKIYKKIKILLPYSPLIPKKTKLTVTPGPLALTIRTLDVNLTKSFYI